MSGFAPPGRPAGAPAPPVELEGVRVVYGSRAAVEIDHFAVCPGELLVVIGPNGSGKSTLLRVLGLLEAPTAGAVRVGGRAVAPRDLLAARRRMASVFQDPLLVDATVVDNVALGLRFRGLPRHDIAPRVRRWMARLGIEHLADRRARTLSGGEAQRTALARALVLQPEVLLLDEAFSALDQPTREALIPELARILRADRITTVLVTHDRAEALALGDRVAAMIDGRIAQVDAPARLFRAPASEAVARIVGVESIAGARIVAIDAGLRILEVAGQTVAAAAQGGEVGDEVRLCLRPDDVTVSVPGPAARGGSRNRLAGTVVGLLPSGSHVRVAIDCGFPLVAVVTHRVAEDLALAAGAPVVASFPPTAAHVIAGSRREKE